MIVVIGMIFNKKPFFIELKYTFFVLLISIYRTTAKLVSKVKRW